MIVVLRIIVLTKCNVNMTYCKLHKITVTDHSIYLKESMLNNYLVQN